MALCGRCSSGYHSAFAHKSIQRHSYIKVTAVRAAVDSRSLVDDLHQLISSRQGLDTPQALEQKILNTVAQLKHAHQDVATTNPKLLSATWKLLWTTEKETLFIMKNAPIFGTKAGDVYQAGFIVD